MKIVHRLSFRASRARQAELRLLGVDVAVAMASAAPSGESLVSCEVDEGHPAWSSIQARLSEWGAVDIVRTEFSKEELRSADWLNLVPDWHHGYPQPRAEVSGYLAATYDLTDWCDRCGIGKKQVAPFQMKAEPKWGKRGILQLNWVFDEFFVTPDVWNKVFEPHGLNRRPVQNVAGRELATVVQLVVERSVEVVTDGLKWEQCGKCNRRKYLPVVRGPFPSLDGHANGEMLRTSVYFGSGASANTCVVVSKALAASIWAYGLRGASMVPVEAQRDS